MRHTGWWNRPTHAGIRAAARGRRMRRLAGAAALATMLACSFGPALAAGETTKEPAPVNTSAPTVTGTPTVGAMLTCSTGVWTNNPSGYTYAWLRSGSPIAGQTGSTYVVQSADAGHTISCQVTASNSGGEYTISGLPSGSYKVEVSAFEGGNYLPQWYSGKPLEGEATPVSVTAPGTTSGIDAALSAGGQITGRVTAAAGGAALANVGVCAEDVKVGGGCATTNGAGEYTIQSLPSGTYSVEFSAFACGETGCVQQNYLEQSVGGVSVTAGSTTPNIDATLAAGGQITGKVTAASHGEPLAKIEVCAEKTGGVEFFEFFGNCATTHSGGEYTIQGLPSGSYDVKFIRGFEGGNYLPQYYKEEPSLEKAESVKVTAGVPTSSIDAALAEGGQIAGRVTAASGGAALANIEVCAAEIGGSEFFSNCATTNGGGEYAIPGLSSGEYNVEFSAFGCGETGCVQQNYLEQSVDDKVVAAPGTTLVNAAMLSGGQITGKVTAASGGAPLAEVEVCAGEASGDLFRYCASTNAGGEYTISGVPSGASYDISFSSYAEGGNYLSQSDSGVAVTAPNTTSGINAALPPGGQISGRVTAASGGAALANVEVCAEDVKVGGGCATTNGGGGSASATSNALAVAGNSEFSLVKAPVFDAKTGDLDFYFQFVEAGTLRWSLYFKNADVGFAASLGLDVGGGGLTGADPALAETAKKKSKRCKQGNVKHKGRCVRTLVPFASGSKSAKAGSVEVQVHPDAKALKALKAGRTLHVSGQFTFQSALGGPSVTHTVSTVVHGHKKKRKKKGGKKK